MLNLRKNKKGFTLVELMVVVVIIGILTAIAIPVYSSITGNAKKSACQANQRTIASAIMQWSTVDGNDVTALNITADLKTDAGKTAAEAKNLDDFIKLPITSKCECVYTITNGELDAAGIDDTHKITNS